MTTAAFATQVRADLEKMVGNSPFIVSGLHAVGKLMGSKGPAWVSMAICCVDLFAIPLEGGMAVFPE